MFGFLKKTYNPMSTYPDDWGLGQGEINGKPLFVRFRSGLREAAGHPLYPFQIGVAVPFINPNEHGLPTHEETNELNELEETIERALTEKDEAIFVASITTDGMREFVFYATE
jgi:uncharacterized protein DUF695